MAMGVLIKQQKLFAVNTNDLPNSPNYPVVLWWEKSG